MHIKYYKQKGQALLFVVVAMTIALSVGVAVSSRTLNSLKRTSSTDTSARVFAAAEGGIEWFLRQPIEVFENLSDGNNNNGNECPAGSDGEPHNGPACLLTYAPQAGDDIETIASVLITKFQFNNETGTNNYWFKLTPGAVKEVALKDYLTGTYYHGNVSVCWKSTEPTQSSLVYYYTYNSTKIQEKKLVAPQTAIVGSISTQGTTLANSSQPGYPNCYTTNIPGGVNLEGLRIKVLYAPSVVAVFPAAGNFPTQGYKIVSQGKLVNVKESITIKRELTTYKSLPYASAIFDYAIYSQSPIN